MNKCVKIFVTAVIKDSFLHDFVQSNARKLSIEGSVVRPAPDKIKIVACGDKDNVDKFVDILHKEFIELGVQDIEVEPFLKDKDYRGVFRIIE
ncbi:MAG: acylphosphatase [Candidatus Babeliaceae bacterium]|jgi:acylphosphatase